VKSNIKSILICFFDIDGIIHKEFVPSGQTINAKFYCGVLRRKRQDIWRTNNWVLHHDKATMHTALAVQQLRPPKT
jgi:hypothetical protein